MEVCDIPFGQKLYCNKKYYKAWIGGRFNNQFGVPTSFNDLYEHPITFLDEWPLLRELQPFVLLGNKHANHPFHRMLFKVIANHFTFAVEMNNYYFKIPFLFATKDERVSYAEGIFKSPGSGRLVAAMENRDMYLTYEDKVVLHIQGFGSVESK